MSTLSPRSLVGKRWKFDSPICESFQNYAYTEQDLETWKILFTEQINFLKEIKLDVLLTRFKKLGIEPNKIPLLPDLNRRLTQYTDWKLIEVDGIVENQDYFYLTSKKIQPFSPLIRAPHERVGFVWPDIFHEICHLPYLFDEHYSEFCQQIGALGHQAYQSKRSDLIQNVIRLFWHLIENGSVKSDAGNAIYGAILIGYIPGARHVLQNPGLLKEFSIENVCGTPPPWDEDPNYNLSQNIQAHFAVPSFATLLCDFQTWRDRVLVKQ